MCVRVCSRSFARMCLCELCTLAGRSTQVDSIKLVVILFCASSLLLYMRTALYTIYAICVHTKYIDVKHSDEASKKEKTTTHITSHSRIL